MKDLYLYLILQVVICLQKSTYGYHSVITSFNGVQHSVKEPLTIKEATISHPYLSDRLVQHLQKSFGINLWSGSGQFQNVVQKDLTKILSSDPENWSKNLIKYFKKILCPPPVGSVIYPTYTVPKKLLILDKICHLSTSKDFPIEISQEIMSFLADLQSKLSSEIGTEPIAFAHSVRCRIKSTIYSYGKKVLLYLDELQSETEIQKFSNMQYDLSHSGITLARDWPSSYHKKLFAFWILHLDLYFSVRGETQNVLETQLILINLIRKNHLIPMEDKERGDSFMDRDDLETKSHISTIIAYIQSLEDEAQVERFLKIQKENIPKGIEIFGKHQNFLEKKKILEFWFNCIDLLLAIKKESASRQLQIELESLICKDLKGTIVAAKEFSSQEVHVPHSSSTDPLISQFFTFYEKMFSLPS